jgi:hypothetical protein
VNDQERQVHEQRGRFDEDLQSSERRPWPWAASHNYRSTCLGEVWRKEELVGRLAIAIRARSTTIDYGWLLKSRSRMTIHLSEGKLTRSLDIPQQFCSRVERSGLSIGFRRTPTLSGMHFGTGKVHRLAIGRKLIDQQKCCDLAPHLKRVPRGALTIRADFEGMIHVRSRSVDRIKRRY